MDPPGWVGALTAEQTTALQLCASGKNIFLTGSAGTGKSHTLHAIVQEMRRIHGDNAVYVTASTGIAATHIGGTTLHSFAGTGIVDDDATLPDIVRRVKRNADAIARWKRARVLVIDEISMVGPLYFDMVDRVGRHCRGKPHESFGGVCVVACGDFFQLPPVQKGSDVAYAFQSAAWEACFPDTECTIVLSRVFRQQGDNTFISLLQNVRLGHLANAQDALLRSRLDAERGDTAREITPTRIYTHRIDVETENNVRLAKLDGAAISFRGSATGKSDALVRGCLAPVDLALKIGAQVMLLINLDPPALVNGSRGTVVAFANDTRWPTVLFCNGSTRSLGPHTWNTTQGECIIATYAQIPLCLAWAFTVHKGQGISLDSAEIDISKCWAPGQAYTALSRVRSIEGLFLIGYERQVIKSAEPVVKFYANIGQRQYASKRARAGDEDDNS